MKFQRLLAFAAMILLVFASSNIIAQTTVTIGSGSSSSSTRGPFQRADTNSSTVFSRFVQTYTAAELAAAGVTNGASLTSLNWELASSNVIIGSGNATMKVYIKNSAATTAVSASWTNLITGSTLVVDDAYNTTNNFPGANGWMPFTFMAPFAYTGGALEIAVDWDCSQVSTPAFSGNGAIKFRWESTAPDDLVAKKTASSGAPSTISDLKDERANIQIVFTAGAAICDEPTTLAATNITATTADLSWAAPGGGASAYNWLVVDSGTGVMGTAVDAGSTSNTFATASGLTDMTMYDFYVASDCGTDTSDYAGPFSFTAMTPVTATSPVTIGMGSSSSSTRGPFQRSDTASSTVFSRFVHTYTASELAAAGITSGVSLTAVNWELASSNVMIGSGNATMKVYIKNSSATTAVSASWTNLIMGSSLVVDNVYNTTNNFPGANGWMPFTFSTPFVYTGGALEIAVDWDCSQVSTPAFSGDGALKWRWESTAPDDLVVKKTASSSAPSTISDLKDERANIQFVFTTGMTAVCNDPTTLDATNITATTADLSWADSAGTASAYNWMVVDAGAGVMGTAVDGGSSATTSATASGLNAMTMYDFYVASDCGTDTSDYAGPFSFTTMASVTATSPVTIGMGSSSSSTRGPFQRSDTASSTVFSRFVHIYTASELAAAGITSGVSLTALNWELASSNVMIGTGDATLKVYIKNSSATTAVADTWVNLITGSTLAVDNIYNTTNNFPGANGWMPFDFSAPFIYTGGALEIAVDWDCSQVSTPAFSGDGSLKWRWESTAPDDLVVKKTASSGPSSTISDLKDERANIQFVFTTGMTAVCNDPTTLDATNITATTADLSWADSAGTASAYNWMVVDAGAGVMGTAVDGGSSATTSATASGLTPMTMYDFYVASDCGTDTSDYAGPFSFTTMASGTATSPVTIGMGSSSSSTRGPFHRADTNSTTVFSRFVQTYTEAELAAAGITSGISLTALNWELASSNVMIGTGDATLKVYIKNSSATMAVTDTWANLIMGSDLVVDNIYNTTNNFPGANGWMPFTFSTPFVYTGGALEIAVDWDCSQVSVPAFSGNGAIKWRWESTAPNDLVAKKTATSGPSSTISDLSDERANIQFVFSTCPAIPTTSITTAITDVSCNGDNDGAINITVDSGVPAYSFMWSNGDTTEDVSGLMAGAYSVTITDGDGCTFTDSLMVVEPTALALAVTSVPDTANAGIGAATITATGGTAPYTYTWNGSPGSADSTQLTAGTYAIMVTDANGCSDTTSVMVDNTVSLSDFDYVTSLTISPNPTNGKAVIELELSQISEVGVSIYSVVGELVESFEESNTTQLNRQVDLSAYADGVYVVRFTINEQTVTKRMILVK